MPIVSNMDAMLNLDGVDACVAHVTGAFIGALQLANHINDFVCRRDRVEFMKVLLWLSFPPVPARRHG
ncbi:hypothetical protein O9929_12925 [Vibrio lentus]|nr:hypothetical protein [Vibrio lentus]